jgi:hypothetical protein
LTTTYLYKYRPISSKDNLINCCHIRALFECYAMLNSRKKFKNKDENDSVIELLQPSKNSLVRLAKDCPEMYKPRLNSWIQITSEGKPIVEIEKMFNDMVDRYAIYCFSATGTNNKMWEEYAENHTGFCIEFIKNDFFQGNAVIYDKEIPSVTMLPLLQLSGTRAV